MDFKNWMLLFSVIAVIGFFSYSIYNSPYIEEKIENTFPSPTQTNNIVLDKPSDWSEYTGETIKFNHPREWQPEERTPFGGLIVEDVVLNIPESTDNNISYSVTPFDLVKPDDVVKEEDIMINERKWTKWVRKGSDYVSYDLYTKDKLGVSDANSFGIHVTLEEENEKIEKDLVILASTIEFNSTESAQISPGITE